MFSWLKSDTAMASLKKSVRLDNSFKHLMATTFWDLSGPSRNPAKTSPKFPDPEINRNIK